ncbi:VOC family protein [Halomicrococcus sp. NG-SE-24]|uniref:VOC family protein n=1 Tax=Halomicrococcus sp. NG-SE-24 TaxID=3436928 RepID=UPI003D98E686
MGQPSLHHHGVSVTDRDRLVEFYRNALGFDVIDQYTLSGDALATAIDDETATGHFAHLAADTARIELVEYETDGDDVSGGEVYDDGAKHLGLKTDDIDQFYANLPDDVETISEPQTTESGTRIFFLRDPDGNLIEILET